MFPAPLFLSAIDLGWPGRVLEGRTFVAGPLAGTPVQPGEGDDTVASRQCGRCRAMFPGDPTLHPTGLPEWWLCPPCRLALLGPNPPRPPPRGNHLPTGARDVR